VRVSLYPGPITVVSNREGGFRFPATTSGSLLLVSIDDPDTGWLSASGLMRSVPAREDGVARVDFSLYRRSEAYGTDWRSAAQWRDSQADLGPLLAKVRSASAEFSDVRDTEARAVLAGSRGSTRDKARAALLASWLDLASARLGFDTPVHPAEVSGAGARYDEASTVLPLVQRADRDVASRTADWGDVRRVLDDRVLLGSASGTRVWDESNTSKKRRPGLH